MRRWQPPWVPSETFALALVFTCWMSTAFKASCVTISKSQAPVAAPLGESSFSKRDALTKKQYKTWERWLLESTLDKSWTELETHLLRFLTATSVNISFSRQSKKEGVRAALEMHDLCMTVGRLMDGEAGLDVSRCCGKNSFHSLGTARCL